MADVQESTVDPEMIARLTALLEQAQGDLSSLSTDEIRDIRTELRAGYAQARAALDPATATDEQVEALTAITTADATVSGVLSTREAEEATEAERVQAEADERARQLAEMDEAMTDEDPADPADPEDPANPAADPDPAAPADPAPADPADPADPPADPGTGTQQASSRPAPRPGRRPSLGSLAGSGVQAPIPADTPRPGEIILSNRVVAAAATAHIGSGEAFTDAEQMGRAIEEMRGTLAGNPNPSDKKHYLGRMQIDRPHAVRVPEGHSGDTTGLIDEAVRRNTERKVAAAELVASGDRRVAAGGICAPATPDYTITVIGEAETPWIDGLPTVQGIRPVSFYPWINISQTDAAGSRVGARPDGGFGTVTAAEDAAGYGGTNIAGVTTAIPTGGHAFKDCVRIDCPTPVTCGPEASFLCTVIGNFQAISFPEYVAAFDRIVHTYFNIYRDEHSLAKVIAASKVIQGLNAPVFGAARDLLDVIRRAATHVRNVRHAPNLGFNVVLPAFAAQMVAQDIAYSWSGGTDNLRISSAQALALLAVEEGIFIETYNVSIGTTGTGLPTVLPELADGQALPDWMDEIRIIMYPEGGIWRQDYGELAFGLRETGMETNDMRAFEEIFEQTCTRTTDILTIDVPLCVNGLQAGTVVKVCGTGEDGEDTSSLGPSVVGPQATNEVHSLAIDATGGTFGVGFDGESIVGVAFGATAAALKTAMVDGMSNVNEEDVTISKVGTTFFLQWHGQYAGQDVPLITTTSALTGGASTATPAVVQAGGQ